MRHSAFFRLTAGLAISFFLVTLIILGAVYLLAEHDVELRIQTNAGSAGDALIAGGPFLKSLFGILLGAAIASAIIGIAASALLSRFAIRDSINHGALEQRLSKSLLQASVVDSAGKVWNFGVVHLHAHATEADETQREGELNVLLKIFAPLRQAKTPHILLGDFNSNSPIQQIDVEACKPRTRNDAAANGGTIPRRVIQRMLNEGYLDTYQEAEPQSAATRGTFSTQFPGQRVDYIFAHSLAAKQIRSAWIEYDRLAKYASDHFPVGAEIE